VKTMIFAMLLFFSAFIYADPVYKCKPTDDLTAYSDAPCKAAPTKKILLKDNTLDHSGMRKNKAYNSALPKPISESGSSPAVSVIPQAKGAGYREMPPLSTTTTNASPNSPGANPAVTTQPWK